MQQRLQKIISAAGAASRRAAEKLIMEGRVAVNGRTAVLGESADPESDVITLDGRLLSVDEPRMYIMLNKPRGYVTTLSDDRGRKCVSELVKDAGTRLYPVGRLDMDSEGLLLMTNDGAAANALMHPSHGVSKTYRVTVSGSGLESSIERLRGEFELDGKRVRAAEVRVVSLTEDRAVADIVITQGLNRQVRRMCEQASLRVHRLRRIAEGELQLGELRSGKWRSLTPTEIRYIRSMLQPEQRQ